MTPVRVLSVASEIYPIIKTGGLADVAGALPIALEAEATLHRPFPRRCRLRLRLATA